MFMNKINIAFCGGRILGYRCLELLSTFRNNFNIQIIIANKKDGEDGSDWNPSIIHLAQKNKLFTIEPKSLNDIKVIEFFKEKKIDIILNAFNNRIIPKKLLDIPRLGAINFHYGKLPKYKGRFIVSHVILNKEKTITVTAHFMSENVDGGDIIFEKKVKVFQNDTAKTLYFRCTGETVKLFHKILFYLLKNKRIPRKKQHGKGDYFPFVEPNGCEVNFDWNKGKIKRFIRAVTFEPISTPWVNINGNIYDLVKRKESLQK